MAGTLTQKDAAGLQGGFFRSAGRRLALILRPKKLEPEVVAKRKALNEKRITAMAYRNYCAVAECDIALGMNETKAWMKAGRRYEEEPISCNPEELATCYQKAGRKDLLERRLKHAIKKGDRETAAAFEIALGADKALTWKAAGDFYNNKGLYFMATVCYGKGGFEAEAKEAAAKMKTNENTGSDCYEDIYDSWKFLMNPHH